MRKLIHLQSYCTNTLGSSASDLNTNKNIEREKEQDQKLGIERSINANNNFNNYKGLKKNFNINNVNPINNITPNNNHYIFSTTENKNNRDSSDIKLFDTSNLKSNQSEENSILNSKINSVKNPLQINKFNFKRGPAQKENETSVLKNESIPSTNFKVNNTLSSIKKDNKQSTVGRKYRFNNSTALKGSSYQEQEWVVSIIENYAREVGISAFNYRTMELYITQFIDNEAYVNSITMINFWRPLELILNQKSENSLLHLIVKKFFKNSYVGFIPRKNFAEDKGKEIYLQSGIRELTSEELNTKYVCMASLAGLISYLDQNSNMTIEIEHLNIKFYYLENHLNISFNSTIDLELLLNSKFNKSFGSLFSLFQCQTVSGFRLLRSNILQPLALKEDINRRYQAVEELCNNPEMMMYIREYLPFFKDLEVNISKFMHNIVDPSENIIKQILTSIKGIRTSITSLKVFREVFKFKLKSELFQIINNSFEEKVYDYLLENIDGLVEEFDFSNTKITRKQDSIFFMLKAGINNVLDVSRKTYSDTVNEIYSEFEKLKTSTNDPNIKLQFSQSRGYYIILSDKYFIEADCVVSRKVNKKIHCANIPLISLSERIKEIKRDLVDISMSLITNLIVIIRKNINYLYVLSSYIALLDVICAFAEYSKSFVNCVKPIINNNIKNPFMFAKNSRHPLHERTSVLNNGNNNDNFFVPNDYFLTSHFNTLLLKGANASGKTTYMKGLALTTILAQIGCFVPCDYFEFTLRKFLYTKFDSNDNVEENRGSYVKEIIEIQKVISNHYYDSLVLLDEPFDNSDSKENLALSIAVLDQFKNKFSKSFIIISSHNNSLSELSNFYFNIVIGTMVVEFTDEVMNFLFKFKFNNPLYKEQERNNNNLENNNIERVSYTNNEENYGIILANMIGFDNEIISKANEISYLSHKNKIAENSFTDSSEHVTTFKILLFKLLLELYELKYISECFVIEEEVIIKRREITRLIKEAFN